jgi:non-specific serine/threonine protein kinase
MIAFLSRADIASMLGDVALAHALSEECATVAAARGERWTLSWAQWNLGVVWWIQGDLDKATAKLRASLRNKIALHDLLGIPFCVESLACVFAAAGRAEDATVLLGITEQMWVPIGKPSLGHVPFVHWREQAAAQAARVLGHNAYQAARGRGARLTFEEAMAYAVGDAAVPQGPLDPRLGCAETRREEIAELVASGFSNRDIASLLAQGAVRRNVERLIQRITLADQPRPAPWSRWHHGQ